MPSLKVGSRVLYYEVHGDQDGPPVVCMGGWGTFCHGATADAPRLMQKTHRMVIFDYPGLGQSTDAPSSSPSMGAYAEDVVQLMDHLGFQLFHVVGLVGMGACVGQELAIQVPRRVLSLFMTGTWAAADSRFVDILSTMVDVHREMGFLAFQQLVASYSFTPAFYDAHRDRLLGVTGVWRHLLGRLHTHERLVQACLTHDVEGQLHKIVCPTFILHAGRDPITPPESTQRLARQIPECVTDLWPDAGHVITGKEQRIKLDQLISGHILRAEAQGRDSRM